MTKLDMYTVRAMFAMLGLILGVSLGNTLAPVFQEPKPQQYIVVEYSPECDCYRVVDVIEAMEGLKENE